MCLHGRWRDEKSCSSARFVKITNDPGALGPAVPTFAREPIRVLPNPRQDPTDLPTNASVDGQPHAKRHAVRRSRPASSSIVSHIRSAADVPSSIDGGRSPGSPEGSVDGSPETPIDGQILSGQGSRGPLDDGIRRGIVLASAETMRVLEARFHPQGSEAYVVVGQLVWQRRSEDDAPRVEPAPELTSEADAGTTLSKLRYLITSTAPGCFERLQRLRSRFWSFVDVSPGSAKELIGA